MNNIPFYIIIAVHGNTPLFRETLSSLSKARLPHHYEGLVIVENGKKSGLEDVIKPFKDVLKITYLYHQKGNKSLALNHALEIIPDNAFIFFTDDDVVVDEETLVKYEQAAAEYGKGHYFGGPVGTEYESLPDERILPYLPGSAKGWELTSNEKAKFFLGYNWGGYAIDFKEFGGFDANFGPGAISGSTGQETNMQARFYNSGLQPVYIKGAYVSHFVPKSKCTFTWTLKRQVKTGKQHVLMPLSLKKPKSIKRFNEMSPFKLRVKILNYVPKIIKAVFLSKDKTVKLMMQCAFDYGRLKACLFYKKRDLKFK